MKSNESDGCSGNKSGGFIAGPALVFDLLHGRYLIDRNAVFYGWTFSRELTFRVQRK
jgi:hypothetical protein